MTIFQSYTTQMVLLGTALLGLASGIAGTFAVLRKESLIGDGLSHAALPGVVIAFLLTGIKDIEVLITGAALSSITAAWLITITVENSKIKFDGALATILSAFFGLGMVLLTYVQSLNNAGQAGLHIWTGSHHIGARRIYHICSGAHHHRVNRIILEGVKAHLLRCGIRQNTTNSRHFHPYFISFTINHDHHYRHSIGRGYLD